MKIISININDLGGINNHIEEYKNLYGNRTYLREWDKLNKIENVNGILDCIKWHTPDIVILQEYDINSTEAQFFYQKNASIWLFIEIRRNYSKTSFHDSNVYKNVS